MGCGNLKANNEVVMEITVGRLIEELRGYPADWVITSGPNPSLSFYRLKQRDTKMVNIEFNETDALSTIYPIQAD